MPSVMVQNYPGVIIMDFASSAFSEVLTGVLMCGNRLLQWFATKVLFQGDLHATLGPIYSYDKMNGALID